MTVTSLPRRLLVGATASALLLGGGAVSLLGSASAAGLCPTYTDVKDDGVPDSVDVGPQSELSDPDMDILSVSHSVDAGVFSSTIALGDVSAGSSGTGDQYEAAFTVGGKAVGVYIADDYLGTGLAVPSRVTVGGTTTTAPVKVVVDAKANTLTAQVTVADLEKAVGVGPLTGKPFSAMTAESRTRFAAAQPQYDVASAPTTASYVFGGSCSGGSSTPPPATTPPVTPPTTTPPPAAGSGLYDLPRKGCVQFTDPAGDATPLPMQNKDDLDITSVVSRTTATSLDTFVHVAALGTSPGQPFSGHQFDLAFTVGGKAVTLSATGAGPATSTVAGAAKDLKATVAFDTKASNVVFSTPLGSLDAPTGGAVTAETAKTTALTAATVTRPGDTAAATTDAQKTYTVGDNTCFLPEAGLLTVDADPSGAYTDRTELFATLTEADETPVEGASVSVRLGGGAVATGVTDADGIADLTVPITALAGSAPIVTTFAGSSTVGAVSVTTPFTVVLEKTVLTAKAGKGTVTATVKDDDRSVVVGQPVTFLVGKKTATVKTDSKGVAVLRGLTKGTSVQVGFATVPKRFAAAPSVTVKAL